MPKKEPVEVKTKRKRASFSPVSEVVVVDDVEESKEKQEEVVTEPVAQTPAFQTPETAHEEKREEPQEVVIEEKEEEKETTPLMVVEEEPKESEEIAAASDFAPVEKEQEKEKEKEEKPQPNETLESEPSAKTNVLILALVAFLSFMCGILLTFIAVRVIGVSQNGSTAVNPSSTPQETAIPTTQPSTSPVSRKEVTIEVQNGSGKSGAAKKAADFLSEKGYTIGKTGNADKSTYEESQLIVKKSTSQETIDLITKDLSETYTMGSTQTTLEDSSSVTIRFIVGKK